MDAAKTTTAILGVGNRGSHLLGGVLRQADASVAALCDLKPDRLDKAASAARDNPKTYTDGRRVIDRNDIEAVFIATPPHPHAEMAVAALDGGKRVYCEKSVGINPQQVKAVLDAVRRNPSRTFTSGQQLRSIRQMSDSMRKIHSGAIGDILMLKAQRHAVADLAYDGSSSDWCFDATESGGYLIEQSVNNLDLCNCMMQGHPRGAVGFGAIKLHRNDPPGRTIFDCGSMVFEYPGAVQLSFTQNVFHPRSMPVGGQYVHGISPPQSIWCRPTRCLRSRPRAPQDDQSPKSQPRARTRMPSSQPGPGRIWESISQRHSPRTRKGTVPDPLRCTKVRSPRTDEHCG